ncbi:MAG TPA: hypothetical protein DHV59_10300 [Oxalobacteraceae bacterium]|nr:hypothetical protein [Oxalobacteraceae bacterium]
MVFCVIGIAMGIGAMLGALSATQEGVGLMVVMGTIGAVFAGAIAGGVCAVVQAIGRKTPDESSLDYPSGGALDDNADLDAAQLMTMAEKWEDEKERFPIAGDPEPISKSITGWRDAADLVRNRDIF